MMHPAVVKLWWTFLVVLVSSGLAGATFVSVHFAENPPKWKVFCNNLCKILTAISLVGAVVLTVIGIWSAHP